MSRSNRVGEPDLGIFVPAIMGAGVVFSAATAVLDLAQRGTGVTTGRNASVRGRLAAEQVLGSHGPPPAWRFTRSRRALAAVGVACVSFAVYVVIGATGNFLRRGGYLSSIAWLWAVSLLLAAAAATIGVATIAAASRRVDPPAWTWPVMLHTPFVRAEMRTDRFDRMRWTAIVLAVAATVLTILVAGRSVLGPFDRAVTAATRADWMRTGGSVVRWVGATTVTLVVVAVAVASNRACIRLGRVSLIAFGAAIVLSGGLRALLDRARPPSGPMADLAGSFPSGHIAQATLTALLLPPFVYALTRRTWVGHATAVAATGLLAFAALHRVATEQHWASDVIAGVLIGGAIGLWARAALLDPAQHRHCRRCAFQEHPSPATESRST